MSFQGDVAGIGLGELLQGLARGGRDGVLTLDGEGESTCFLGLKGAQIHFLPSPGEDTDVWRERCNRAWADFPDPNLEAKRRSAIAHAARRETLYGMLEAPNLHFRFEPGPLKAGSTSLARGDGLEGGGGSAEPALGPGYSVEFLLLEHARIQDESGSSLARDLAPGDMPRAIDSGEASENARLFLGQCDGASTLEEVSDRLGWPLRQTRGIVGEHMSAGRIRIADHRELLVAGQRELELGRVGRGAARIERWVDLAPPGPLFLEGEAEILLGEWRAERLILALNLMSPRRARAVMRRLDLLDPDREAAHSRWEAFAQCRRRDPIIGFKCAILAAREQPSEETDPVAAELLSIARGLQDRECPWRARSVLRLAASQAHEKMATRLEIGGRLVQVGLAAEASPLIIAAATELLDAGEAEKAIPVLRALVSGDADQREASALLQRARAHKTTVRRKRRNMIIAMSVVAVVSIGAFVQLRVQREYDTKLALVTDHINQPEAALALLEEYFGDDESPRVGALRLALEERHAQILREAREEWMAEYREISQEVELGDPLLGLRKALDLGMPPTGATPPPGDWPTHQDLFGLLAKRLETTAAGLEIDIDATVDEQHAENRVVTMLADLLTMAESHAPVSGIKDFEFFVGSLRDGILERQERRADERQAMETKQLEEQQDLMLAGARAHAQAGDLKRAVAMYDRLLALDASSELRPLLADEVAEVRRHHDALGRALERAHAGDHAGARRELEGICPNLAEHQFPFRIESEPSGVRATFRESTVRVTPFVLYSSFGEKIDITFQLPGCETRRIALTQPQDTLVYMYRLPERAWETKNIVEAAPVPVSDDHVLCDRAGRIVRLARDGSHVWSLTLESLGGLARTPVFLPRRPGYLLVLSEDGLAWLVNASNGQKEGPVDLGKPPVEGPVITRTGVSARFTDGRVARWSDALQPEVFENDGLFDPSRESASSGRAGSNLVVLKRSADSGTTLSSQWSDWTVEVEDDLFRVSRGNGGPGFTVRREGAWTLVGWEAPNALVPDGRLWVSDEAGIRCFRPSQGPLGDS